MKKTNNAKVNKVNENAKANNIDAKQLTTIQIADDVSVTLEAKTLSEMESWAMHTYRDLSEDSIHVGMAYEDGKTDIIGYTEDELNQMIVNAGLVVNLFDSNDDNCYCVTGANVYESCMRIIDICKAYIHALHGNYDAIGLVKPKYTRTVEFENLSNRINHFYHALYTVKSNIKCKFITEVPYSCTELCSISGVATHMLDILNKYDCSDVCNVELTKYFCTEAINIVNDLLDTITTNDTISCSDNQKVCMYVQQPKTKIIDTDFEYDDF